MNTTKVKLFTLQYICHTVSALTCNTVPRGTLFSAHQFGFEPCKTAPWPSDTCWELVIKHTLLYIPTVLWWNIKEISNDCPLTIFEPTWLMDTLKDGENLPGGLLECLDNFSYVLQVKKEARCLKGARLRKAKNPPKGTSVLQKRN